jgi:hypothetical protein
MLNLSLKTFSWHRVSSGYCVVQLKSVRSERIFANEGPTFSYFPFANADNLFAVFARLKSKSDLLGFVHNFGPLTYRGFDNTPRESRKPIVEKVELQVEYASEAPPFSMSDGLCKNSFGSGEDVADDLEEAAWFRRCLDNNGNPSRIRSIIEARTLNYRLCEVVPGSSTEAGLELRIKPGFFLQALQFQLFQNLSSSAVGKFCRQCGIWFRVGPGLRRSDSKFCSDEHRVLFNSAKRSKAD